MAHHVGRFLIPALIYIFLITILSSSSNGYSIKPASESRISNISMIKIININDKNISESYYEILVKHSDYLIVQVIGKNLDVIDTLTWSNDKNSCDKKNNSLIFILCTSDNNTAFYGLNKKQHYEVNEIYFCQKNVDGKATPINPGHQNPPKIRSKRDTANDTDVFKIHGFQIETKVEREEGIPRVLAESELVIRLFGIGLTENTLVGFTEKSNGYHCDSIVVGDYKINDVKDGYTGTITVVLPPNKETTTCYYMCAKRNKTNSDTNPYLHQGQDPFLRIQSQKKLLPLWLQITIIVVCLCFSSLFSGLNLGLMSMDRTELKILCNTGTEQEKKYAKKIQPVREHGNYLLCSILFSNVLVNSLFTILLDDLTQGFWAIIISTLSIVIVGEISPQAFCSRHGLCVGAKTIYITKLTMWLTLPLSYPTSMLLDFLLGEEIGNVYNRERLKELVKVTTGFNDLEKDEVNIISGALELRKKTVSNIMTKIEDVYMLDYNAILDFETVSDIMKSGYSRIPVYEGIRNNIITMLYIKDLAFVDPDDNTPLKTLCQYYQNPCNFVFEDVTLDVMFKQFKEGHKGHMAFVRRVNNEGEGDPFYEVIGLVTLEDVIEELIQAEIMDETDVFTDNRSKRKRLTTRSKMPDFTVFAEKKENHRIHISPQLTLATFQYLSTTVDSFKPELISETILRRLLKQDIIHHIKVKSREKARNDPLAVIYQQGQPVDYFVLILEGRVEVTVGQENLMFESGPFTYFGCQALSVNVVVAAESPLNANPQTLGSIQSINLDAILRHTFVPDYTVRAITEVFYVKVKRSLYLAAKRASLLERSQKDPSPSQDQFDDEVEKLLHSLDEDDHSPPTSPIAERIKEVAKNNGIQQQQQQQLQQQTNQSTATNTLPVSASPNTNSTFLSQQHPVGGPNGQLKNSPVKIQELSSVGGGGGDAQGKLDLDDEIANRQAQAALMLNNKKLTSTDDEEMMDLLSKQNCS
ncbi:hypothetical protein HCN44_004493 [Aphidius gifuensis]|uniref:Uncharacterized protein n=1 Tax=Aphidius gifuensis TaxID=684658 RepID=A0A834XY59_APHGI|nr:unextended protein [Aphidius gifuensis]KAF7995021.1 hypothetical protein HCN44_004493 [Aphidius gifuensis]